MMENLVQKVKNAVLIPAAALTFSLGSLTGCVNDGNLLNPRGEALLQDMGVLAAGTFVQEGIKGKLNPDASNVSQTVVVQPQQPQTQYQQQTQQPGRYSLQDAFCFVSSSWDDLNNDGTIGFNEIQKFKETVFSNSEDEIRFTFVNMNKSGTAIFKSWTRKGELLGETSVNYVQKKLIYRYSKPGGSIDEHIDFLDKVRERGVGAYKLSVTIEDGRTFWSDLVLIE